MPIRTAGTVPEDILGRSPRACVRHHAASPFCDSLRITVRRPDAEPNQMPFVSGIHQYARPARMTVDLHDLSLTSRQWAIYDPR